MAQGRNVILYEVNEVPWSVLDYYVELAPDSNLARLLSRARLQTTVVEDPGLQPWRTWPTFHTGLSVAEHNCVDLGQDPATFRGETIWDAAEAAGLSIGLFGPLQSWPARQPRHGAFYIPDTFSRDGKTYPASLQRFQEFNLAMTREQGFSSDTPLAAKQLVAAGVDLVLRGLAPSSAAAIVHHLFRERRDARYKGCRSVLQALPSFDLFWRLHRKTRPNLSIFFTNHVAGMLHRYWGDTMPDYAGTYDYVADPVFATFVPYALDLFDRQLGKIMRHVESDPDSVLIVASSMGQIPMPPTPGGEMYIVRDTARLMAALGLARAEDGLAMYPATTLQFSSETEAALALKAVQSIRKPSGEPLFFDLRVLGKSAHFNINSGIKPSTTIVYSHGSDPEQKVAAADIGIAIEPRLGGANTAYHSPEGPMLTYGAGVHPDPSRGEISALEAAPMILEHLGIPAPRSVAQTSNVR